MTVPTIPVIPAKMGEAGAHQEQLYAILSAIKAKKTLPTFRQQLETRRRAYWPMSTH